MSALTLAANLTLPLDAATQKLAWIGTTGSGKTYGAMNLAELFWKEGVQFAALDTMGIWYGMRLSKDGKTEGVPITVFGGRFGDLPIRPADGRLVAEAIVETGISAIVDISTFDTDADKSHFVSDFSDRLYRLKVLKPSAFHLFLEEAHEFIPQNPQGGEATMVHHMNRLWKQGRNYGIGGSIISQRPQDVNKKSLELSSTVFAFNITGSNAFDAMNKWMKGLDVSMLPSLKPGECLMWSPSWLGRMEVLKIGERATLHVSFDPNAPFAIDTADRSLPAIKVDALREKFAAIEAEESEHDPKKLQARIKDLERQLQDSEPSEAQIESIRRDAQAPLLERIEHLDSILKEGRDITQRLSSVFSLVLVKPLPELGELVEESEIDLPPFLRSKPDREPTLSHDTLNASQTRIVEALAALQSLGKGGADRKVVGALAGQSHKSGSYGQNLAVLRRLELIETTGDGLSLTAKGKAMCPKAKPPTLDELHGRWRDMLTQTQGRMLTTLIKLHPKTLSRDELASLTNQSPKSGSFGQNLARLRSFGLVEGSKELRCSTLVFPEGLK